MGVQAAAGTLIAFSATLPTTFNSVASTGYPSETYLTIGEVVSIPAMGSMNSLATHSPLGEIDVVKGAGSRNHGSITLPLALDADDAGQAAVLAAIRSEGAFKVTFPDGAVHYTTGIIMGFQTIPGGVNDFVNGSITIELTRPEVRIAAP